MAGQEGEKREERREKREERREKSRLTEDGASQLAIAKQ